MQTLEGLTVVSLEQAIAAPFAARHLADLGARVIKVERPTGDFARSYDSTVHGLSSHFVWVNRNKESIVLDLKQPADLEVLLQILEEADVFLQNLAPGATDRLGLGQEALRKRFPELITCEITGYGRGGPYEQKKAYDLLVQCESGVVSITGTEDSPSKTGIPVADIAAGMYAYSGILAALIERSKTGRGRHVEVSMLEALGEWMGYPYFFTNYGESSLKRTGASHAAISPYGPHRCANDESIFFSIQSEREWEYLTDQVLALPQLANDPRFSTNMDRVHNRDELTRIIEDVFTQHSIDEIEERLEVAKIANARLRTPEEFAQHPQLQARNRWMSVPTPSGEVKALMPVTLSDDDDLRSDSVPALGEHTEAIKEEFAKKRNSVSTQFRARNSIA